MPDTDGVTPFMDSLAAAGTPNGFALQLCGRRLGLQKTGNYWIGGYDSSFTNTTMRYIQIVKKEYFNVQAYSLNINGEVISGTEALQSQTSIVDSGRRRQPAKGQGCCPFASADDTSPLGQSTRSSAVQEPRCSSCRPSRCTEASSKR